MSNHPDKNTEQGGGVGERAREVRRFGYSREKLVKRANVSREGLLILDRHDFAAAVVELLEVGQYVLDLKPDYLRRLRAVVDRLEGREG